MSFKYIYISFVVALATVGCVADTSENESFVAYFGDHDGRATPFPSNRYAVADSATRTGLRFSAQRAIRTSDKNLILYRDFIAQADDLDGFGTSAPIAIAFSDRLDVATLPGKDDDPVSMADASLTSTATVQLFDIATKARIETTWFYARDTRTLFLRPTRALSPAHTYGYIVTSGLTSNKGVALQAASNYREVLAGNSIEADADEYLDGYSEQLQSFTDDIAPLVSDDIVLADVFTTMSVWQKTIDLHKQVDRTYDYTVTNISLYDLPSTSDGRSYASVKGMYEGTWTEIDYRNSDGRLINAAVARPERELRFYLATPTSGQQPHPVVLIQHGLGDSREVIFRTIEQITSLGFAAIAIDAPGHGDRYTRPGDLPAGLAEIRDVLGFWLAEDKFDIKLYRVRDVFRQASIDHRQIIRAMQQTSDSVLDLDNNGTNDFDTDNWAYYGQSMGAIIGSMSVAQIPDLQIATLNVGGARMSNFVFEHELAQVASPLLESHLNTIGDSRRFGALVQTILEPGDPVNYVRSIVDGDIEGTSPRNLLMQFVLKDSTVPNALNWDMAYQAQIPLGLPAPIQPPLQRDHTFNLSTGLSGNLIDSKTGGLLILDEITTIQGEKTTATHGNMFGSIEGAKSAACFFQQYFDSGSTTISTPLASCQ